ncbi:MAG: efflux RND transporter permease subunit [Xenococcaceae cyanobacterium MO_188.B29]|nr:efflux RND transporter permease subunit [Xenococcaceae cyanobacterium MO_188.B29]
MSFHFSSWSIKNPVPILVLFLILGILGITSFRDLEIDNYPNIDIPSIKITITQQGASPQELESEVTRKIEDAVVGLDNIEQIISSVREEVSITNVGFELGTDSNHAVNEVRNAVAQVRQDLPEDINEPIVEQEEFYRESIMTYAVNSPKRSVEELSNLVDRKISRALLRVPGVAEINRLGGVEREIRVNLDSNRLEAYKITATEVNNQIRNSNLNLPGGRLEVGNSEQNIRTLGSARTVKELLNNLIVLPSGETIALSALGEVKDSSADPRQSAYLSGESVVAFSVQRSTGSTLVTVEQDVRKAVAKLQKTLPKDINISLIFTRADIIRNSYTSTLESLILGSILTVLTVGIFLRNWRITLITSVALPLSIIPTFWVMKVLGYSLNSMTLLALALAVGNLVDDAICMIENIDQHLQMDKSPFKAAFDAAREIGLAVVATTATIVAVFIPVSFMGGVPGQFFQPFGLTFAISTMFSTLVACTMTPMLSAYLLKPKEKKDKTLLLSNLQLKQGLGRESLTPRKPSFQPYSILLTQSLRYRVTTLLIAIAIFISSLQLVQYIPQGLSDSGDNGLSIVSIELPPGSTLRETESVMQKIYQMLQENPAVENVLATTGDEGSVNNGTVYIKLLPTEERTTSQQEFETNMREVFQEIPGTRISFRSQGVGVTNKDLSIVLKSENVDNLNQVAKVVEAQMRQIPGLVDVDSSIGLVRPEIAILPNLERAAELDVSVRAIAQTASIALLGEIDSNLAKFNLSDRQIPIRVQIDPNQRNDISNLKNLQVPSNSGTLVPLSAVADIRLTSGPVEIRRLDRSRQVVLEANLQNIALGDALKKVRALPAMNPLPPGVTEEPTPGGDAEIMRDVFNRFSSALALGILSIYAILVLLYNNFLYPLAILIALPMSVGGALIALLVTQKELGLFALIGMVLLMGLVTKNAILLVDFSLGRIKQGKSLLEAVVEAGISRLRPILMTSFSTIAGMIPIALEWGTNGEVRSPMAIAVIGGFTTSTLLTLIVVPVLFTYVDNFLTSFLGKKDRI